MFYIPNEGSINVMSYKNQDSCTFTFEDTNDVAAMPGFNQKDIGNATKIKRHEWLNNNSKRLFCKRNY